MSIHLLSTITAAYLVPFQVTAASLLASRRASTPVTWHVFEPDMSPEDRAAIEAGFDGTAVAIAWHRYAQSQLADLPLSGRAAPGMYERIFAPDELPATLERVVYLDADLLVLDAIDALWRTDLTGSVIGAVQDAVIPFVSSPMGLRRHRALGLRPTAPYFNAGVLVMDLAAWRAHRVRERAFEYLRREARSINLADQDALNAVLHGRWARLADRWNVVGGLTGRGRLEPKGVEPDRLAAAARDPAIVHFSGHLKPWIYARLGSRWADAYADALREACPGYRVERSLTAATVSFYDRRLRTLLQPLERLAWRTTRYLR